MTGIVAAGTGAAAGAVVLTRSDSQADPVRLFGAPGSFTGIPDKLRLDSGDELATVAVDSWRFGAGQAAFGCAVSADGTVFMGTTPFTDNPLRPTAADMEIGVLTPSGPTFVRMVIPSSLGRTVLAGTEPGGVGGGDVSAIIAVPKSDPARMLFVSTSPFHGWDPLTHGELPTVGSLTRAPGGWRYNASASLTSSQLAATSAPAVSQGFFPRLANGIPDSRGTTDAIFLPRSGHVIIAQYFGSSAAQSGGLLAFDPRHNRIVGGSQIPPTDVFGRQVTCRPRQLAADPSSALGDERFALVYDVFDAAGAAVPYPIQEFSYDHNTGEITRRSTAVRAAQDGSRMELAQYLPDGTLVVARTRSDGLSADTLAVYAKGTLERHPPALAADGNDSAWGSTCTPDQLVGGTGRGGLVRSLTVDAQADRVLIAGLDGLVQSVGCFGPQAKRRWRVGKALTLPLTQLRSQQRYPIGLRQAALDPRRRLLWLPCNQQSLDKLPWPIPPVALDQWMFAVAVDRVFGD